MSLTICTTDYNSSLKYKLDASNKQKIIIIIITTTIMIIILINIKMKKNIRNITDRFHYGKKYSLE